VPWQATVETRRISAPSQGILKGRPSWLPRDRGPRPPAYPVLPLRDIVVFPHMIVPLFVGREKSVRALEEVMQDDKQILLSSQIDPAEDDPTRRHLQGRRAGQRAATAEAARRHREGAGRGRARVRITEYLENEAFFEAPPSADRDARRRGRDRGAGALRRRASSSATPRSRRTSPKRRWPRCPRRREPAKLADLVAGHLGVEVAQKQELLETLSSPSGWRRSMA
jgi:ATP-dependent Lon protease